MGGAAATSGRIEGRERLVVYLVALTGFMVVLDANIVNVALPSIAHKFGVDTGMASRVVLGYLLVLTAGLLPTGKLIELAGLRRVYFSGFAIFTAGSLLCGLAPSLHALSAFRCLQGLGGSLIYVASYASIPRAVPAGRRGTAFGIVAVAAALGTTVGAPLGGLLTTFVGWQGIFLINVPLGAAALFLLPKILGPDSEDPRDGLKLDWAGALFSGVALGAFLFGMNNGAERGWTSPAILATFGVAAACTALFGWREHAAADPVLDPAPFRVKGFLAANLASCAVFSVSAGSGFLMPFYMGSAMGASAAVIGLALTTYSVATLLVGPVAGRLADRWGARPFCIAGMCLWSCACAAFAVLLEGATWPVTLGFLAVAGCSAGLFISPNNSVVMGLAPRGKEGAASAVSKTFTTLAMTVGVCLMETVFSASLPVGATAESLHGVHHGAALVGFRYAYFLACALAASGAVFSLAAGPRGAPARDGGQGEGEVSMGGR